jgi:molecular chaperone GrpE
MAAELERAHDRIDQLTRAYAALERDREEYKKRLQREREQLLEAERGEVALALLEVADGLDLALANADRPALVEGVRVVREDVLRRVQRLGIERINLVGTVFDPNLAEAVALVPDPDPARDNAVLSEVQAAYRMKGRLVRAGKVRVARFCGPASP